MVPDYYEMLGVDPGADRAAIEEALARCQPKWSAGRPEPEAPAHLPVVPRPDPGDPPGPARRPDRPRRLRRRAAPPTAGPSSTGRSTSCSGLVRLRAAKGGLTVSDRDRLRARGRPPRRRPGDELDRLLEPIPPLPEAPAEPDDEPDAPADVIDPATRGQIRRTLDHLGRRDLYDALGLPRDAPQSEIVARADAERQRWRQKSRVTAEMTAWLEAVSYAQSHLGTPEARARYDRTLELEAEERFREAVALLPRRRGAAGHGTRVGAGRRGGGAGDRPRPRRPPDPPGLPAARGGDRRRRAGPDASSTGRSASLRCRDVPGRHRPATTPTATARPAGTAAHSLRWECPICQRDHWVDEPRCACGFRLELREPMLRHFEAAQHAHRARDYASALAHLHRIQEFAPDHPGTRKAVEKVKRAARRDRATPAPTSSRSWPAATCWRRKSALRTWAALVDPTAPEVADGLRRGQPRAPRGPDPGGPRAAMLVAPTRPRPAPSPPRPRVVGRPPRGPRRPPPLPARPADRPRRPSAEGMAVRLRWNPPAPDGLGAGRPSSSSASASGLPRLPPDGEVVAETDLDRVPRPRRRARRGRRLRRLQPPRRDRLDRRGRPPGRSSSWPTCSTSGSRPAAARSTSPGGCPPAPSASGSSASTAAPRPAPTTATAVEALPDGACDRGLADDRVYHYGIYAVYRTPDGSTRFARGVTVAAMPHPPVAGRRRALELARCPTAGSGSAGRSPSGARSRSSGPTAPPASVEGQTALRRPRPTRSRATWLPIAGARPRRSTPARPPAASATTPR